MHISLLYDHVVINHSGWMQCKNAFRRGKYRLRQLLYASCKRMPTHNQCTIITELSNLFCIPAVEKKSDKSRKHENVIFGDSGHTMSCAQCAPLHTLTYYIYYIFRMINARIDCACIRIFFYAKFNQQHWLAAGRTRRKRRKVRGRSSKLKLPPISNGEKKHFCSLGLCQIWRLNSADH